MDGSWVCGILQNPQKDKRAVLIPLWRKNFRKETFIGCVYEKFRDMLGGVKEYEDIFNKWWSRKSAAKLVYPAKAIESGSLVDRTIFGPGVAEGQKYNPRMF